MEKQLKRHKLLDKSPSRGYHILMKLTGIICMSKNQIIGNGSGLAWDYKADGDMAFFKKMTENTNVIVGRKTFEGMGSKPLKSRNMFILTRKNTFGWTQCFDKTGTFTTNIATDIQELPSNLDYWVIGGKEIYLGLMDQISEFYVTTLTKEVEGDVLFTYKFEEKFKQNETVESNEKYEIKRYWN